MLYYGLYVAAPRSRCIGFLGIDPRPGEARARALGALAAHGGALPARGPAGRPAGAAVRRARSGPGRGSRPDVAPGLARDRGAAREHARSPTPGTSRRPTARCATSRAATRSTPTREDYLVPHHHRHPHRPDLPVPAGRVAPPPGRLHPDLAAAAGGPGGDRPASYAIIDLDLSRYDSIARALPEGAHRGALVPQGGDRDQEPGLQPADRAARAGRHRLARSGAAVRARPARASPSSRAGSTS